MSEIPIECAGAHMWKLISNALPLPLGMFTNNENGTRYSAVSVLIWRCATCHVIRMDANQPPPE